jgi:glycosyltransferase involved in cell wall biosynthesis
MPTCAVGVMAHDEEPTIGRALRAILDQKVESATITAVVVVSSGSRDATDHIVRAMAAEDVRVHLLTEPERRGKISADNLFFSTFPAELYALCNADVILEAGALEALLAPLRDPTVGIVGARVRPRVAAGRERGFFDFANHLLWEIHHRVVLVQPKMGEAVAFRPLVDRIPEEVIADEAFLEATAHARGLKVVYAAEANVSAGCPLALGEYFSVRRRNTCAHELLNRRLGHPVATLSAAPIVRALREMIGERLRRQRSSSAERPQFATFVRDGIWLIAVVALEVAARGAGKLDARYAPHRHVRWRMARSARRPSVVIPPPFASSRFAADTGRCHSEPAA